MIHVIIPVYRGLAETKRCIESVLRADNAQPHRITVIDDCSPDEELKAYLVELSRDQTVRLLRNERNLGFVATVNRGMELDPQADVVLLNSDTEVSGDWLDRLHRCACRSRDIGTVTPFSNNATICSYPGFCEDNSLPDGWSPDGLDTLFRQVNAGRYVEIPTAVGFCMYIKRDCLNEVGLFDVERFGKGYGEENDFCMRARKRGWRHVLCADTFVFHAGGVSFAEAQVPRKQQAQDTLRRLYPSYLYRVSWHVMQDPARPLRHAVDFMRIRTSGRPVLLFVTHRVGGGTERHIRELIKLLEKDAEVLVLKPHVWGEVTLAWQKAGEKFRLYFKLDKDYSHLLHFLRLAGVVRVHFHHLMGHSDKVKSIAPDLGVPFDFTVHDYFMICPRVTLTSRANRYCGEPDEQGCNRCVGKWSGTWRSSIQAWRDMHIPWLNQAERVFVPSRDALKRIKSYAPSSNAVFAPHFDIQHPQSLRTPVVREISREKPLKILVIGGLNQVKGLKVMEQCAVLAKANALPLHFHLIGFAKQDINTAPDGNLTISGRYEDDELPALIADSGANLAWFPAQCPETYSYTLSAALLAGMPVAVPDLGAFPERVANRPFSWVCPWNWSSEQWNSFFVELYANNLVLASPVTNPYNATASPKGFSYRDDYLIHTAALPALDAREMSEAMALVEKHSRRRLHLFGRLLLGSRLLFYKPVSWLNRTLPVLRPVARLLPQRYRRRINDWLTGRWP